MCRRDMTNRARRLVPNSLGCTRSQSGWCCSAGCWRSWCTADRAMGRGPAYMSLVSTTRIPIHLGRRIPRCTCSWRVWHSRKVSLHWMGTVSTAACPGSPCRYPARRPHRPCHYTGRPHSNRTLTRRGFPAMKTGWRPGTADMERAQGRP
eukprot:1728100-Rhodomonas_salina.5